MKLSVAKQERNEIKAVFLQSQINIYHHEKENAIHEPGAVRFERLRTDRPFVGHRP